MPRPTINDVARHAGVSKGAVSFALNDRPGVADETRKRILAAARELGWTPSHRARALSVSRALAVGLVMARQPETLRADPFFPSFIAGVEGVLSADGYALLLQVVPEDDEGSAGYRRLADQGRVDGVFLTDLLVDDPRPALLAELGLPAVIVGSRGRQRAVAGGRRRRPARASSPPSSTSSRSATRRIAHVGRSRGDGARPVAARGLGRGPRGTPGSSPARSWRPTSPPRPAPTPPTACSTSREPPTAIVYANDLMAMAGLSVAAGRGVDVPGQLSVTGFDDTELAAHVRPALTTVATDVTGWGRAAATRLLELVDQATPTDVDLAAAPSRRPRLHRPAPAAAPDPAPLPTHPDRPIPITPPHPQPCRTPMRNRSESP